MTAWNKYKQLYKKMGCKLRIKIHEYIKKGVNPGHRSGSESLETFIIENSEEKAVAIMEAIENEHEKNT